MVENNIDKKIETVVGETIEDAIKNEEPVEIEIVSEEVTVTDDPRDIMEDFYGNLAENMKMINHQEKNGREHIPKD